MSDQGLENLFLLLRRPIFWDPVPPWIKLKEEQFREFTAMEMRFEAKFQELETQKLQEFAKIAGIQR
jgi:hypothetical protein